MSITKTLGGDRLGSGKKMKVEMHNYERSTFNLSKLWRTTMSSGTLVPCLHELALPGDTWDIELQADVMTHPTVGPLFGGYKSQTDIFTADIRLYQGLMHNNEFNLGLKMNKVYFPSFLFNVQPTPNLNEIEDLDNSQVNPSCVLHYLGIKGFGINKDEISHIKEINATPYVALADIYKNYYANKQEGIGAVIHTPSVELVETVDEIMLRDMIHSTENELANEEDGESTIMVTSGYQIRINYTGTAPLPEQIIINVTQGTNQLTYTAADLTLGYYNNIVDTRLEGNYNYARFGNLQFNSWRYLSDEDLSTGKPGISTFPLENIDIIRKAILKAAFEGYFAVKIGNAEDETDLPPYNWLVEQPNNRPNILSNQEGLFLKTYQSDLLNNWLKEDTIENINTNTAIDVSDGLLYMNSLIMQRKLFDIQNRIAVSGGSTDDWLEATYAHEQFSKPEIPIYHGGLIRELMFQEVVSNSESDTQPLGTLAGKGVLTNERKGGTVVIKVDEPCYIIGITSLTPRIDYSQGNSWDIELKTVDEMHKPGLDQIGFQDLITTRMAWWDSYYDTVAGDWAYRSAGKQPAWINYQTEINETHGNFAIGSNEMFMTLNRRYEATEDDARNITIKDLTTYIDPSKYNFIFAETALDAQNFWVQIGFNIKVRRKMSSKLMPNL